MVHIKSSLLFVVLALIAVNNVSAQASQIASSVNETAYATLAADASGYKPVPAPAAIVSPSTAASSVPSTKKAKGEIAAGGQIAVGSNLNAKGGFNAGGVIAKFNAADAATVGVGGGTVTGPVDGWKAQGEIGAGGNINNGVGTKMAEGGFKAAGDISSFKGVGANGELVQGKNAKGRIAAGGEIVTKSVKAKGGFHASGEMSSLKAATPGPSPPAAGDAPTAQGAGKPYADDPFFNRVL